MVLAIEIAFLIAGLYALFTAKMPPWITGKGYRAEGNKVRILGAAMAALLPGILCMGVVLGLAGTVMDFNVTGWATGLEIGIVILMAIVVTVVLRNIRVPDAPSVSSDASANIEPK